MIEIEIDKLTNSIEEVATGRVLATAVLPATAADLKAVRKKDGWKFDWRAEAQQPGHSVYKLVTQEQPALLQGLISLENLPDHLFMPLIETAPFNFGKAKAYAGVAGNLVAFACKLAFEYGHQGNVGFVAKTELIAHYIESLGAERLLGHRMAITTGPAFRLVQRYFKDFQP